ncbi:MAG: transketolase [Desulfococcus multivorans]|jgi:transketolase|nr:transketolase [Desulfococcus multivorans]
MNQPSAECRAINDQLCINTIRTLSLDAVQAANSGHPGAPMGLAPAAYVLWTQVMKHNPKNPQWPDRDRFVLSGGHASMLLYSVLHLTGYDVTLEDIRNFRQWGSKTPGHPEYGHTPGVETTTGPLGQGIANAVGMAMAERFLADRFNREGNTIVDHHTYVMCGDGDLMEGISYEAASLAGHLGLGKLICIYDDNRISIEGSTDLAFTENTALRFEAMNWHVQRVADGNDVDAIRNALTAAKDETEKPSVILLRTHIAYGSPNKQDTADAHGAPLGEEEVRLTKINLGCSEDKCFCVLEDPLKVFRKCVDRGQAHQMKWLEAFNAYATAHPEPAREWNEMITGTLPEGWDADLPAFSAADGPVATRSASGRVINGLAGRILNLIGGSADLGPSNKTHIDGAADFQKNVYSGRNIRFGVREHAMGAILSGLALHGGIRPFGGTFLVFADYMRASIRLASLMKIPVTYVFTHDSVAVGEDGPTHQPVEHLMSLRAIPGLTVIRPADANETREAWRIAMTHGAGPTALILSRQKLPVIDRKTCANAAGLAAGGYILLDCEGRADIILIATGAEVHLILEAQKVLAETGVKSRVVGLPSWELFEKQDAAYKDQVLPPEVKTRLAVEAGQPMGWERYVGARDAVIGIDTFGTSAPGSLVLERYGFTVENVVQKALALLNR